MTAVAATFSDFALVRTRKVARLTFEVPLEQADAALAALGGVPRPDQERWCGIAPIDSSAARVTVEEPKPKPRSLAQRVAMVCQEPAFAKYVAEKYPSLWGECREDAADFVRDWCGVASRAKITDGTEAHKLWQALYDDYRVWLDHPELVP